MNRKGKGFSLSVLSSKKGYVYPVLIAIFALSIFLRFYGFNQDHGLTFDEGLYSDLLAPQLQQDSTNYSTQFAYRQMIKNTKGHLPKYLDRPLFKHPPLYCYLIAFNYDVFGKSDRVAVSVSIILGSLAVLVAFFFGKLLYDQRVGLIAAAFMCIEPVNWVCSERIWMETTLAFFMFLGLFFFALGERRKHWLGFALSGLAIGLAMFTKYPAVLCLCIISSYALVVNRPLLRRKDFWMLYSIAFIVFLPWIIWNWRVYSSLDDVVVSAHALSFHSEAAMNILSAHKKFLFVFVPLAGILLFMHKKIKHVFKIEKDMHLTQKGKNILVAGSSLMFITLLAFAPFFREMMKDAFVFKDTILVGWSNPFRNGPWHFYVTRLCELSPLFIFSYLGFFLLFGKNKGDKLLIFSSLWVMVAFILLGNYQSRYVLPAVPFLVILSARFQVWAFDQLSGPGIPKVILKSLLIGVSAYFVVNTLRVDSLIAIGPDFGYF